MTETLLYPFQAVMRLIPRLRISLERMAMRYSLHVEQRCAASSASTLATPRWPSPLQQRMTTLFLRSPSCLERMALHHSLHVERRIAAPLASTLVVHHLEIRLAVVCAGESSNAGICEPSQTDDDIINVVLRICSTSSVDTCPY